MFPEDLGGNSQEGPTSIWALREFQSLHGVNDACRGAVLTNIASLFDKLYRGTKTFKYRGPLPNHCPCVPQHNNLRGVDAPDALHFCIFLHVGRAVLVLDLRIFLSDGLSSSLRDGGTSIQRFARLPPLFHGHLYLQFLLHPVPALYGCFTYHGNTALSRLPQPRRFFLLIVLHPILALSPRPVCPRLRGLHCLASPPTVSAPIVPASPTAYVPGSSRSRTPRTTKAPLTLLRWRGGGRDGVLTGALRRSRSVRFTVHLFPVYLTPCVVVVFLIILTRTDAPTLSPNGEIPSAVTWPEWCGYDVGWAGTTLWDQR